MAPKHTERARFRCNPLTTHSVPGPVGSPNGSLYGVLLNHLQTFLARADERAGPGLPAFVRRELYRNLPFLCVLKPSVYRAEDVANAEARG